MKWPTVQLGEIAKMVGGGTPSKKQAEFWSGEIPWVSPKDMRRREVRDTEDHITEAAVAGSATQVLPEGTIIFVVRSGILVRRFPVAVARVRVALNQDMKALVHHDPLLPDFLAYFLEASSQLILTQCVKRGATVHSIDIGKLKKLIVPVPAKSEQRRVVELLDHADALRKKRAEADAKAVRILPALFYEMFGDPVANPMHWVFERLSDTGATVRYGLGQPPATLKHGVPLIRATNISAGRIFTKDMIYVDPKEIPPSRNAFLSAGEVLIVRSGAYTGDIAQVTQKWEGAVAGYDLVVSPGNRLVGEFLEAYLLLPFIQKGYFHNLKARAGQPHLNAEQVADTPVPVVPVEKQNRFAACVNLIRQMRIRSDERNAHLSKLFDVLLHRAFSGEITRKWREAHMMEVLAEMEQQAKLLNQSKEALLC